VRVDGLAVDLDRVAGEAHDPVVADAGLRVERALHAPVVAQ
jgi:hypothetical protein